MAASKPTSSRSKRSHSVSIPPEPRPDSCRNWIFY